jgi:hypothetical protein
MPGSFNQTLMTLPAAVYRNLWADSHGNGEPADGDSGRRPALVARNCADDRNNLRYFRPQMTNGEAKEMQLSQMWREHLQAGCPPEIRALSIAGTAAPALDAEITACVSACVTHSLKMDSRIQRRLNDIAHALEDVQGQSTPEVAAYCTRLNKLVSAVLVNAVPATDATEEPAKQPVRPRMRRR